MTNNIDDDIETVDGFIESGCWGVPECGEAWYRIKKHIFDLKAENAKLWSLLTDEQLIKKGD